MGGIESFRRRLVYFLSDSLYEAYYYAASEWLYRPSGLGTNQAFWVDVFVKNGTAPGLHSGTVAVGLYSIATAQCILTALCRISYHIQ